MDKITHDIAFVHTANIHVETFSKLMADLAPELSVRHDVHPELLACARERGIDDALRQAIGASLLEASATQAKVVVCTCSTIGSIAESLNQPDSPISYMRIDRAMADEAVALGNRILLVAALESTLAPTEALLQSSAKNVAKNPSINSLLVENAWAFFEQAHPEAYYQCIAKALQAHWQHYDVIVLAQASMAGALRYCQDIEIAILSSPRLGVMAAIEIIRQSKGKA